MKGFGKLSKYELSLSKDYVPSWTVVDAVREMFQNALDQQITIQDNEMFFNYDEETQTLSIGNKLSVLNVETLLLGSSTKRDDPNTIGQFGEGYKIATLVLTRLGKKVVFYNYGNKEVWMPRFVKARRYNNTEILTFFIDSKYFWQKVPDNNLTITIDGITPEEYAEIVESNLHLQDVGEFIISEYGRILKDESFKSKVYVNGLFVCRYDEYEQGYDFKPQYIKIDRDRKLADSFQLKWLSSKMLSGVKSDNTIELIKRGAADVAYITSAGSSVFGSSSLMDIADTSHDNFKEEHGAHAIPVTTQDEYDTLNASRDYKPVFVNESYSSVIKASPKYEPPVIIKKSVQTSRSKLEQWLKAHNGCLSKRAKNKLKRIIEEVME